MALNVVRVFVAVIALMGAAEHAQARQGVQLIRDVTVIDVERGEALPHRSVLIEGERITRITSADAGGTPPDARVVDGRGLYLMPGLFDAHVHISAGQEAFEPLLIAHGITAVRDTGASTEMILNMRAAARGEALSPTIFATGAIVDGKPPVWPFSEECDTPEDARAAVERLAAAGVDQIKVYERLKPEVYRAAIAAARERGLKVTGHIPPGVTLVEAMEAGLNCVEHLQGMGELLIQLSPAAIRDSRRAGVMGAYRGWFAYDQIDRDGLRDVLRKLAGAGMVQCPTVVLWNGLATAGRGNADPEKMKYIPASLRLRWEGTQAGQFGAVVEQIIPAMRDVLREMHEAGVPMMIGTDLANPYIFPGSSVHAEMAVFQEAGIPAAAVLRMATIVPARFCSADDRMGTIEEGKEASLVLVRANPLESVAHASQIEGVFLRGRYLDRTALDDMLKAAARRVSDDQPAEAGAVDLKAPGEVVHRGRLRLKFGQWDAGHEDFVVSRDGGDWHVRAHSQPMGGGQTPSMTSLHLRADGSLARAGWVQLTARPTEAEYRIDNGRFIASARRQGNARQEQSLDLPERFVIGAPAQAADMVLLPLLGLKPGDRKEVDIVGFGFPGWAPQVSQGVIRRLDDAAITVGGKDVPVSHYVTETTTQMGVFKGSSWIDQSGLLRRSELVMPFGTLFAEYEDAAR